MKKKLLFDLTSVQESPAAPFHGGAEYAKMVFKNLSGEIRKDNLICCYNNELSIDDNILKLCRTNEIEIVPVHSITDVSNLLARNDIGKFYSALPYHYQDLETHGKDFILTLHGLRTLECPSDKYEYFYRKEGVSFIKGFIKWLIITDKKRQLNEYSNIKKLISKPSVKILTVSKHSKYSILANFPFLNENQVRVLYAPHNSVDNIEKDINGERYFLLVSANRWEKNAYRAIMALDELMSEKRLDGYKVKVVGVPHELAFINKLKNRKNFETYDYVSYDKLNELFANAYVFLYPSLNEGYGYPPLKAFEFQVPVLASAHSSIIEVCKDAPLYFNPLSIMEIKNRILQITMENEIYQNCVNNGLHVIDNIESVDIASQRIVSEILN